MNTPHVVDKVRRVFSQFFSGEPLIVRSPGRVNLIGEHTDYNEGFVLPAAIDKAIYFAVSPRKDQQCRIYAVDMRDWHECSLDALRPSTKGWPNYVMGVLDQMQKVGKLIRGFDCVFGGDIPVGAGMSSSAAVEAGLAFALDQMFELNIEKLDLAKLAQKAENEFVGVQCGIMDQFTNLFGREKNVVKLDCRSLHYTYYPFEREDLRIVLCNTGVRRGLASSEYNVRRGQCEAGVKAIRRYYPEIRNLRDVKLAMVDEHIREMDITVYNRCKYVICENERVHLACVNLQQKSFESFGKRMFESHNGLRHDYEVSCPELDFLVEIASTIAGVFGARMMGAGFGGCTINLVEEAHVDEFRTVIHREYKSKFGRDAVIHACTIRAGTSRVTSDEIIT